ncbi:hypothetical protein EDC04DRAFT_2812510 [Pisolithus marmoratus]|nr:hypothetical protein EDC04DRAFT_2812510 [Pisolithus marmoratus]
MRVPLLSPILAGLVTAAVGSAINPDTGALQNVERQAPVQVCLPCLASDTACLVSVPTLCCSGVCTQTSSDVPELGTCGVSRRQRNFVFWSEVDHVNLFDLYHSYL